MMTAPLIPACFLKNEPIPVSADYGRGKVAHGKGGGVIAGRLQWGGCSVCIYLPLLYTSPYISIYIDIYIYMHIYTHIYIYIFKYIASTQQLTRDLFRAYIYVIVCTDL